MNQDGFILLCAGFVTGFTIVYSWGFRRRFRKMVERRGVEILRLRREVSDLEVEALDSDTRIADLESRNADLSQQVSKLSSSVLEITLERAIKRLYVSRRDSVEPDQWYTATQVQNATREFDESLLKDGFARLTDITITQLLEWDGVAYELSAGVMRRFVSNGKPLMFNGRMVSALADEESNSPVIARYLD